MIVTSPLFWLAALFGSRFFGLPSDLSPTERSGHGNDRRNGGGLCPQLLSLNSSRELICEDGLGPGFQQLVWGRCMCARRRRRRAPAVAAAFTDSGAAGAVARNRGKVCLAAY